MTAKRSVTLDHRYSTHHRQEGVVDAESRLRGEVLIRDEADPDLIAFGSVTGWYRL